MFRLLRAGLALGLAGAMAFNSDAIAFPRLPSFHRGEQPKAAQASEWPQAVSDVPADPAIRFGVLPNGLRYAIRRQATPPGQAALRLWIGAGSLMEADGQQGLAHFLEHMAFNGSKAVPEGDMVKILERLGLAFGADTNASTGFSETTYKLDLPRTDDVTLDTSIMLLRETAGALSIDQAAVDRERGVVLSEERARDTPGYRILTARMRFLLPGQRLPQRFPIGKVEVLQSAQSASIRAFYDAWYSPRNAVLVAVGDFDPTVMETRIKARFGDWSPRAAAGAPPDLGRIRGRKAEAKVLQEPGAPLYVQIAWVRPPDLAPDTQAKRRRDLIEQLGFQVLNRRLSRLARSPAPPFLGAIAMASDQERSARLALVTVTAAPADWRGALAAAEQEQRRIVQHGIGQEELDREIDEARASLKAQVASAATRRPADLASDIVASLADSEVVTAPSEDLRAFEQTVKGLRVNVVSAALKAAFDGEGPLVFMASPQALDGGDATLLAAYDASRKVAVEPPKIATEVLWPYEDFGDPGKVVDRKEVADLDTVFVRFANGVRLTVKPTRFRDDEVLVRVNIGEGLLPLRPDRQSPAWMAPAFIEGGLKRIDAEDMEKALASKVYGARFAITEDALVLTGATRTEDLETQLQVLTAYVSEPGWRAEAFERLRNAMATAHDQYEATDFGVLQRDLGGLVRRGDRRFTTPSRQEIAAAAPGDLPGAIGDQLASGPIEVEVVGDVTVEQALEAVAETLGALPPRAAAPPISPRERSLGFPDPSAQPLILTHKGRADQSIGYVAWPTDDYFANPQRARDTAVLGEVLKLRLLDELRESQGATYSPSVDYLHSLVWTGFGYIAASAEVPPGKLAGFLSDIDRIAGDLREKAPDDDELARAKTPRIDAIAKAQLTNQYWLNQLAGAQADPRRLDVIRQSIAGTERVTGADVQRAAQTFLQSAKAWRLNIVPEKN